MNNQLHEIRYWQEQTRSYETRYMAEIAHSGLRTYRILKDAYRGILHNKVNTQFVKWDAMWERKQVKDAKVANQSEADQLTREARQKLQQVDNLLLHTLDIDDTVDWQSLKDKKQFKGINPRTELNREVSKLAADKPVYRPLPIAPDKRVYEPKLSVADKLLKFKADNKINEANMLYEQAMAGWNWAVEEVQAYNKKQDLHYERKLAEIEREKETLQKKYAILEEKWAKERDDFYNFQDTHNAAVEVLKKGYFSRDGNAIIEYCEMVLDNSEYPDSFPKDYDLEYNADNKLLIVEYILPGIKDLPSLSEVKYIASKNELKETHLSEAQLAKIYDTAVYNIALRTIHELFEADKANAVDKIVFNGWVLMTNRATGKEENNCILSVQTTKPVFLQIDLSKVDPKACFMNLQGVSSNKLTAIKPLIQVNSHDKRFAATYDVTVS
jgi:restriction system protein